MFFHVYFFVHCSFFFFIPLYHCLRSADDERVSRTVEVETLIPKLADQKNEKEQVTISQLVVLPRERLRPKSADRT